MKMIKLMAIARHAAAVLLVAFPLATFAAEQKTFATPEAAVDAYMAALKANDDAALIAIFGAEHRTSSSRRTPPPTAPRAQSFWRLSRRSGCSPSPDPIAGCC